MWPTWGWWYSLCSGTGIGSNFRGRIIWPKYFWRARTSAWATSGLRGNPAWIRWSKTIATSTTYRCSRRTIWRGRRSRLKIRTSRPHLFARRTATWRSVTKMVANSASAASSRALTWWARPQRAKIVRARTWTRSSSRGTLKIRLRKPKRCSWLGRSRSSAAKASYPRWPTRSRTAKCVCDTKSSGDSSTPRRSGMKWASSTASFTSTKFQSIWSEASQSHPAMTISGTSYV